MNYYDVEQHDDECMQHQPTHKIDLIASKEWSQLKPGDVAVAGSGWQNLSCAACVQNSGSLLGLTCDCARSGPAPAAAPAYG
jgi:hypothetical protein